MEDHNVNALAEFFGRLYDRWQDEKEYEDFADYREAFDRSLVWRNGKLVKMTASPFRVEFTSGDFRFDMKATAKAVTVDRVPIGGPAKPPRLPLKPNRLPLK